MAKKNSHKSYRNKSNFNTFNNVNSTQQNSINGPENAQYLDVADTNSQNVANIPSRGLSARSIAKDIYAGKSSAAIAAKYGRPIEEINAFLEKSYSSDRKTLKELRSYIERADEHEKKEVIEHYNEEECEQAKKMLQLPTITFNNTATQENEVPDPENEKTNPEDEKTEVERTQELLSEAEAKLNEVLKEYDRIDVSLTQAYANRKHIEITLRELVFRKEKADEDVRKYENQMAACLKEKEMCKIEYDKLNEQLEILCAKPKLIHISAVESERKRIRGTVYVSKWDYEHMSEELKALVTPVDTDGMDLIKYPKDFMRYPERMGMESFRSACEFALAYMNLYYSDECSELELLCCDDVVMELAKLQV